MGSLTERNPSLWVGTTPATSYPTLVGDVDVDVAVIGAGITGLSVATLLKRAGTRVAVVEAGHIASGVTGYTTAKVTSLHGLMYRRLLSAAGEEHARQYAAANQAAIEQVAQWVAELDIACDFRRADAYTYTADPARLEDIEAEVTTAKQIGLPASFTDTTELPYSIVGAIRLANQAMFHPRKYCIGLAAHIPGDGSHLFEHTRAVDVTTGDGCEVVTANGRVRAQYVVLATHIPFLDSGGYFARTHPSRSYALAARATGTPPAGMYLGIDTPTRSVRSHIADEGSWLILGGEGHKVGQDEDTHRRYAALEAWAREHFAVEEVAYRWSAQDYMPVDDVPYIGRLTPGEERILVATGYKKWGMTTGTLAGMLLSDRILGRDNPWSDVFDATRLEVRRSARQFVTENLNVAKRFVGDRLGTMAAPRLADLAPGEGRIVEVDGQKLAAFRDDDGGVHAVSPHCSHMGCLVTWNTAEQTWDCPCHGSRYDIDGRALQGPTVKDLERRDIPNIRAGIDADIPTS